MISAVLPAIILATPISAEDSCEFQPDSPDSCLRIIGCTFQKDVLQLEEFYFVGTVVGWDGGPVKYTTSTGVTCEGTWLANPPVDSSLAVLICDDGTSVSVDSFEQSTADNVISISGSDNKQRDMAGWVDIATTEAEIFENTTRYRMTNFRNCAPIEHPTK